MAAPIALSLAGHLPFKYVGGDPALDLVNTVDWTHRGPAEDRLTDYDRLTRWAEGASVIAPREGTQLRAMALEHPRLAERVQREAIELRWQLRQLLTAIAHGGRVDGTAELDAFNAMLRTTLGRLELGAPARGTEGSATLVWRWVKARERLDSVLWPVVRSAAELLVSAESSQIRECSGNDCGWVYVDRSRNGLRRWCEMATCGNREKSRRRAER